MNSEATAVVSLGGAGESFNANEHKDCIEYGLTRHMHCHWQDLKPAICPALPELLDAF
ncbi:MAG TPA: hypothetical protein GXX72_00025 [Clostridiaceae bacterium]|nr:hypothetical protein [Clostridiaceae bacterium]